MNRSHFLVTALLSTVFATGCASMPATSCSTGALTSSASGAKNFDLVPSDTEITIYPGQSKQISVYVAPVGGATGAVQIEGSSLPQGLTVSKTSATIGSTANLTVSATSNIVSSCFSGASGVYTAGRSMTLTGTSDRTIVNDQLAVNVVLEDPSFVPASTNLPVLTINTAGGAAIDSEDDYVNATFSIVDAATPSNNYTGSMGIKGHGNSTWTMPKKPYRMNLDSKAPLLGMTSDSNWILLANYDDKTMLRNDVSFKLSQEFGMAWTPSTAFVEVYLNGEYEGTYQLSEKVEVSKARLNIGSLDDTDTSGIDLTGGYLAEIDTYGGDTFTLKSGVGLPIGLDDPDPPATEQAAYFSSAFTAAETSMYSSNFTNQTSGWRAYWDQGSVVNWFLIEELTGNQDANDWSSDYFYKPRGDALFYRGPVWDMDVTMGNVNYSDISDPSVPWVSTQAKWYVQLLKDPSFVADVKAQWAAVRPKVLEMPTYIDGRAADLQLAAQNNNGRWPTFGEKIWPNSESAGSYQGEIDFMKAWLTRRIAYMDAHYLQ